jgi:MORN repeat variant
MKKIFLLTFLIVTTFCIEVNAQTQIKKEYYPSGKLRSETPYVPGGIITGVRKEYLESGVLQYESMLVDNVLNGTSKIYYETGEIMLTVSLVDGKKDGRAYVYYKSGNYKSIVDYKEDVETKRNNYEDVDRYKIEKTICPGFPEWQKLMDNGKYEKAYNLAIDYAKVTNYGKAATAFQDSHKSHADLCWFSYSIKAAYKMGNLKLASEIIQKNCETFRSSSEPELYYTFVQYVTEFGEKEFAANNLESAYSAIKWAVTASKTKIDLYKGKNDTNASAAEVYHLAELYGDILNKHGEQPLALQYYTLFKKSQYSNAIDAKIAAIQPIVDAKITTIEALKKAKNEEYNLLAKLYDYNKIISIGILGEPNISFIKDIYTSFIINDEEDKNKKSIGFKSEEITLAFNNDATELYVYIPVQNVQTKVKNKWRFTKVSAKYMVWDMKTKQKTLEIKTDDENIDNSKKKEEITTAFIKNKNIIVPNDKNPNSHFSDNPYRNFGKDVNDNYYFYYQYNNMYLRQYIYTYINNGTEHQVLKMVQLINENRDNYAFTNDASGKYFAYANKVKGNNQEEIISFYVYNLNESDKLYTLNDQTLYQPFNAQGFTTLAKINQIEKDREITHQKNLIKYKPIIDSLKLEIQETLTLATKHINDVKNSVNNKNYDQIMSARKWSYKKGNEKISSNFTLNIKTGGSYEVKIVFDFNVSDQVRSSKTVYLNYTSYGTTHDNQKEYERVKYPITYDYAEILNKVLNDEIVEMNLRKFYLVMEGNVVALKAKATYNEDNIITFYSDDNYLKDVSNKIDNIKKEIAKYEN